ncbi:MAG: ThuA domain-containing protein [Planctomycetota bacterium]|nr:ThuA domain-containing protein [Planctomycetota bacterium]
MKSMRIGWRTTSLLLMALVGNASALQEEAPGEPWVVYEGGEGPGRGKHVVLVAGDEEYRSEEALPMLARILAVRHGFRCTMLWSVDEEGTIDPNDRARIPGLESLATADMLVLFTRFRRLSDEDMRHVVDYVERGGPILGIRTATHAFNYEKESESPYARWSFNAKEWPGGFGKQVLGETWVSHHGRHGSESTRGVIVPEAREHPILRGVEDVWGPTDVYGIRDLPPDATVLIEGAVLAGMEPDAKPVEGEKNDPRMPIVWIRERALESGKAQRVICSTIGASMDLKSAHLRRVFVNACYWGAGLEEEIPDESDVDYVGDYAPTMFGFGGFRPGVRPADHALPTASAED